MRKASVLIVEDSALIAMDLASVLEDAGFLVLGPVNSVAAALALIAHEDPDTAVLDINLGRSDVFVLADALSLRRTRLIFLSGHSQDVVPAAHRHRPLISKPYVPSELLRVLREQL